MPHSIKDQFIRDYFSSKSSKVFLPIYHVWKDNKHMVDKEEPTHDSASGGGGGGGGGGGIKTEHLQSKNEVCSKYGDQYRMWQNI